MVAKFMKMWPTARRNKPEPSFNQQQIQHVCSCQRVSTLIFLLKYNIFPSSTNDMLLRSTLKASVSLVRLLLFFTLEGSCFAYDEMIVRVSGREWVVLNVVDSDQRRPPLRTAGHLIYIPPVCGQSAANLPRLHASCPQHPPNMCVRLCATAKSAKEDFAQVKASKWKQLFSWLIHEMLNYGWQTREI